MDKNVQIRQFRITDRDALLSFLLITYPDEPRKCEPSFWNWHFLENPNVRQDDIPLWIVTNGEKIVGQLATIPVTVKVGNDEHKAIWILDFIVHSDFRGMGLGKRLVLEAQRAYPTMITLGINSQSEAVFRRLKWTAVGGLHRYHKLLFPGNAFAEIARFGAAAKFVNLIYAPFRRSPADKAKGENCRIRAVEKIDDSFAELWHRVSSQWKCSVVRDPAYLEWQFMTQPGKKFEILGVYDKERLVGYIVLFFRKSQYGNAPSKVAITDLVYDAESTIDVLGQLLDAAIRLALDKRAGSIVTDFLDERIEKRLESLGFWRIRSSPQFMSITDEPDDLFYEPRNWFLTRADSDVSIFEEPNV
ncbi:hypothetical protein BH10ACI3_BH10ACI3_14800 [soil metagenome]